jgi:hypothetical protein
VIENLCRFQTDLPRNVPSSLRTTRACKI